MKLTKSQYGLMETFVFEDGATFDANCAIIGISPDLSLGTGYDDSLWEEIRWTPAQKRELADYMISLWTKYREETK